MNKIYTIVWSAVRGAFVVTHELAKSKGKPSSTRTGLGATSLVLGLMGALGGVGGLGGAGLALAGPPNPAVPAANALPTGGQVVVGAASIAQTANRMDVNQSTQKAILNWQSFNIGAAAQVNFAQPNASAVALNRVLSSDPSAIYGKLTANGQVFLVNQAGVLFGAGSRVDVGALVASTLDVRDADFMAGRYAFGSGSGTTYAGSVLNQGSISGAQGGYVTLLAPEVRNEGVISASLGTVLLAGAEAVTLSHDSTGLQYAVDKGAVQALVDNKGLVQADGGQVILSARSANTLASAAINNSGTLEAKSLTSVGGRIVLSGDSIALKSTSQLNATGATGGGTVLVGGDWQGASINGAPSAQAVYMAPSATIDASATASGSGGKVVLWSDNYTGFFGTIDAKGAGPGGNGGVVETSSHRNLQALGRVHIGSSLGKAGSWLLDPYDVTITDKPDALNTGVTQTATGFVATSDNAVISMASLQEALNAGGSVTISTGATGTQSGTITVAGALSTTGTNDASLTLAAAGNIVLTANSTITSGEAKLNTTLSAGTTTTTTTTAATGSTAASGSITLAEGAAIATNGGDVTLSGSNASTVSLSGANITTGATDKKKKDATSTATTTASTSTTAPSTAAAPTTTTAAPTSTTSTAPASATSASTSNTATAPVNSAPTATTTVAPATPSTAPAVATSASTSNTATAPVNSAPTATTTVAPATPGTAPAPATSASTSNTATAPVNSAPAATTTVATGAAPTAPTTAPTTTVTAAATTATANAVAAAVKAAGAVNVNAGNIVMSSTASISASGVQAGAINIGSASTKTVNIAGSISAVGLSVPVAPPVVVPVVSPVAAPVVAAAAPAPVVVAPAAVAPAAAPSVPSATPTAPTATATSIATTPTTPAASTTSTTTAGQGGSIVIRGQSIDLASTSKVDASGATGGGSVVVGGAETSTIQAAGVIDVSASPTAAVPVTAPIAATSTSTPAVAPATAVTSTVTPAAAPTIAITAVAPTPAPVVAAAQAGTVELNAGAATGNVVVSGTASANSDTGKGGSITATANTISLTGTAKLSATGATSGGTVLVGGDWQGSGTLRQATTVTMDKGASINVSATQSGNGGKAVLWSDVHNTTSVTRVDGQILAKGGSESGDGGKVETSGHRLGIGESAKVNASAPQGNSGEWLLDPANITIAASGGATLSGSPATNSDSGDIAISTTTIQDALSTTGGNTNVSLTATGNISIDSALAWSANRLTLSAGDYINVNAVVGVTGTGGLTVSTNTAGATGLSAGYLKMKQTRSASTGVGADTFDGKINFTNTTAGALVINGETYTVVTSAMSGSINGTISANSTSKEGKYAIGQDMPYIGWTPIDYFWGKIDGLGHTMQLSITTTTDTPSGLIGRSRSFGTAQGGILGSLIQNLGLVTTTNNVYMSTAFTAGAGGFVGETNDTTNLRNVFYGANSVVKYTDSSGTSTATSKNFGGLVGIGYNLTLRDSYNAGSVFSPSSGIKMENVGGLIGKVGVIGTPTTLVMDGSYNKGEIRGGYQYAAVSELGVRATEVFAKSGCDV